MPGYHCQHLYPVSTGQSADISTACLKGRDAAFLSAAEMLGMKGQVFALWNANSEHSHDYDSNDDKEIDRESDSKIVFSNVFQCSDSDVCMGEYGTCADALDDQGIPCKAPKDINFVNNRSQKTYMKGMSAPSYGNEPSCDTFYYTAAVVVQVPSAKDRNISDVVTEVRKRQRNWAWHGAMQQYQRWHSLVERQCSISKWNSRFSQSQTDFERQVTQILNHNHTIFFNKSICQCLNSLNRRRVCWPWHCLALYMAV